jgi:phosphonate metabolism protein PhnN/1,5-bisphosphokinase (PRPP-forming)
MTSATVVMTLPSPGTLFLVVGPSGAGKDSLIRAAHSVLSGSSTFSFPRRVITRPADPDSEDFVSVTPAEFERLRADGGFCLDWAAHGLSYGVPAAARVCLDAGSSVVVNVSRAVVAEARRQFPAVRVIHVTAPDAVLQRRLEARGRASDGNLDERRNRRVSIENDADLDLTTIVNDRSLEEAGMAFIDVLLDSGSRIAHP